MCFFRKNHWEDNLLLHRSWYYLRKELPPPVSDALKKKILDHNFVRLYTTNLRKRIFFFKFNFSKKKKILNHNFVRLYITNLRKRIFFKNLISSISLLQTEWTDWLIYFKTTLVLNETNSVAEFLFPWRSFWVHS